MSGYLHFDCTGVPSIDAIADVLESAGNSYHHTERWGDERDWRDDKKSYLECIQDALNAAAAEIKRLEAQLSKPVEPKK